MNNLNTYLLSACVAAVVAAIPIVAIPIAGADNNDPNTHTGQKIKTEMTKLMLTNKSFVEKAAAAGQAEVELSQLALTKSQNAQTQAFAKRMIKDHTAAAEKLRTIAQSENIPVPSELDRKHISALEKIGKLTGNEFDGEYQRQMRDDHDAAVTLFSAAASDEKLDAKLREFAEQTLPVLREHQSAAHSLK